MLTKLALKKNLTVGSKNFKQVLLLLKKKLFKVCTNKKGVYKRSTKKVISFRENNTRGLFIVVLKKCIKK
jgi:hypothetical protein